MIEISCDIEEYNLSRGWARAFLAAMESGVKGIVPLNVTVKGLGGGAEAEDPLIREALEGALTARGKSSCRTVSSTIFPTSLWNPEADRGMLFDRYRKNLPKLKEASPANKYGLYFERFVSFGSGPKEGNQLEQVISTYKGGNHRRSALQVAVFDPARDHSDQPRRGFPCLHQVAFTPLTGAKLAVTGFYATLDLVWKAYGNYLGLYNLGRFMAHELDLELSQLTCFTSVARLGDDVRKGDFKVLAARLEEILGEHGGASPTTGAAA
jgi:hypothetical protein